jgi:thiol-disulfide isomerase/thioredoxin
MKSSNQLNQGLTFFITVLLLFVISRASLANEIQTADIQPMSDIRWQDVDGNTHHLKDSNGKPRLLHFWAAWCFPCRAELPEMLKWQQENSDIQIIPLSLDQRMAQAKHFIKKYKLAMSPLLIDKDDSNALEIPALPYTIFVTADGTFSGQFYGIAPWQNDEFTNQVRQHFALE